MIRARLLGVLLGVVTAACGGQVESRGAGGATSGGGGGTAGTSAGGTAGTSAGGSGGAPADGVVVLDQNDQPIAGAIVVVDRADGSREEKTTDAKGVATFGDVDFASETLELTAFSPGRILVTVLDVSPTSSRVLHLRPRLNTSAWTRILSLKFSNKVSSDDCINVSSTAPWKGHQTCGDSLEFPVLPGATGKLLAVEFPPSASGNPAPPMTAAVAVDIPSADDTLEIDLAKSAPIEHTSGTVELPKPDNGLDFSQATVWASVTSVSRTGALASVSASSPVSNGMVPWQADFFRPFSDAEARTTYSLIGFGQTTIPLAEVTEAGYFAQGSPTFPVPAAFVASTSSDPPSLFASIAWVASADRPDRLTVSAKIDQGLVPVWTVWFSPQRAELTLAKPPDSIWKALDWSSASQVAPSLEFCDPGPEQCNGHPCTPTDEPWCARYADSFTNTLFYDL